MSDELTPITRKETFLAKAGGQNVVTPTPITREETFLQAIIDNGSGGGGGGGVLNIGTSIDDHVVPNYVVMDKTWNEITSAPFAVCPLSFEEGEVSMAIVCGSLEDGVNYNIYLAFPTYDSGSVIFTHYTFSTDSVNGYPRMAIG